MTLDQFDEIGEMQGKWTPYCYASNNNQEYLIIFNVYGAATLLEVLRILEEGKVESVGFIGSAFSKSDKIGSQLLVTTVYDQAGIVQLDEVDLVRRPEDVIEGERQNFADHDVEFSEVALASVPCVLHGIESVTDFVESDKADGVEMELSTFFHFSSTIGINTYACVYVSDNPSNSLLSMKKQTLQENAMPPSSQLIRDILANKLAS